jgi:hypothetical protein
MKHHRLISRKPMIAQTSSISQLKTFLFDTLDSLDSSLVTTTDFMFTLLDQVIRFLFNAFGHGTLR